MMVRMLGYIRCRLRATAGALLLLSLLAMMPLISDINADGGATSSTVAATVRVVFQNLEVTLTAPGTVSAGETFDIQAVLINTGSTKIRNVESTILLPEGITVNRRDTQNVGALQPDKEKKTRWRAESGTPGSYVILVTATGTDEDSGIPVVSDATIIIEVTSVVHALQVGLSIPEVVGAGDRFKVEAVIQNTGSADIENIEVVINLPEGISLVGGGSDEDRDEKRLKNLRAGKDKKVRWKVLADTPGSYVVMVTAAGVSKIGGVLLEADAGAVIEVTGTAEPESNVQVATATFGTLEVTIDAPATSRVGKWFNVTAVFKNASSTDITLLGGAIRLPEGVSLGYEDGDGDEGVSADADLGTLGPSKERTIEWRTVARAPGRYVIVVFVTWRDDGSGELLDGEIRLTLEATHLSEKDGAGPQSIANFASRVWKGLRDLFAGLTNA